MSPVPHEPPSFGTGVCYVLLAFDVGHGIDLDEADRRVTALKERGSIRPRRHAPQYFDYSPIPLRVTEEAAALDFGGFSSQAGVEIMIFDFGALSVMYRIPIEGPLPALVSLSEDLYENPLLLADARRRVERLLDAMRDAVDRPNISSFVEDYAIFQFDTPVPATGAPVWAGRDQELAQILRCEHAPLSDQEVKDALTCRISFGRDDLTIIDWHAAVLFGSDLDDVRAVLEFANVELLERRILDRKLDGALDEAYTLVSRKGQWAFRFPGVVEPGLRRIARLQVDGAMLFERVTNTLKLLGDQYLARVYRLASQRFHLESWDAGIQRKLQTLESIYGKLSDRTAARRMELLEWIIIVLIALSILLSFLSFPACTATASALASPRSAGL